MWVTKHQSEANENSTVSTVESATREVAGPSEESEGEVGGWERPLGTRRCEKEPAACRAPYENASGGGDSASQAPRQEKAGILTC